MIAKKIVTAAVLTLGFASTSMAEVDNQLIGVWKVNHNLGTEYVEFTNDNKVIVSNDKQTLTGDFSVDHSAVNTGFSYNGVDVPVNMSLNDNHLIAHLQTLGKDIVLTKVK